MRDTEKQAASTNPEDSLKPSRPSPSSRVVSGRLFRVRAGHGWRLTSEPPPPEPAPVRRPAHVARMLALAHRLERAIADGQVTDRAALGRELGLTRARISQVLDLVLLAPDIQEALLFAEAVDGREPLSVRALRPLLKLPTWEEQRNAWRALTANTTLKPG